MGKPVFWVLSEKSRSKYVEETNKQLDYAIRIFDEMTAGDACIPNSEANSQPVVNLVVNATVSKLKDVCNRKQRATHPVSAFYGHSGWMRLQRGSVGGGEDDVIMDENRARSFVLSHLCSTPKWLWSMLLKEVTRLMPLGVQVHKLRVHKNTIQYMVYGNDLLSMNAYDVFKNKVGIRPIHMGDSIERRLTFADPRPYLLLHEPSPYYMGGGSASPQRGEASCKLVAAAPPRPVAPPCALLLGVWRSCRRVSCLRCRRVVHRFLGCCDGAFESGREFGHAPLTYGNEGIRTRKPSVT